MEDLSKALQSLKLAPAYISSSWSALPAFVFYHYLELWVNDNTPPSDSRHLWVSITEAATTLANLSYFNIYGTTEAGVPVGEVKKALAGHTKELSEIRMKQMPAPVPNPVLTPLFAPIVPKPAFPRETQIPLVSFGPIQLFPIRVPANVNIPPGPPH